MDGVRLVSARARATRLLASAALIPGMAVLPAEVRGAQASLEYGGTTVRNMIRTAIHTAQERWYYVVGGLLVLILLWGYLKK